MLKKKHEKKDKNLAPTEDFDIIGIDEGDDEDLAMIYSQKRPKTSLGRRLTPSSGSGSNNESVKDRVCKSFARWIYDAGIPFKVVKYPSFNNIYEVVGQYGPSVKPPTYHEIKVPFLKKDVKLTRDTMKEPEEEWRNYGCSIPSNGWKDQ
ncbi:hypothetical protein EZV62_023578 [Acer yangbiense]|uniref:Uncharacterized protein n=1 Tax=Acer yangbiense TaxID=1000413 RepID=A0A5C7H229_9ROSI|nr:hypothetical protein EZV62_023578 [Acer yangbiense]